MFCGVFVEAVTCSVVCLQASCDSLFVEYHWKQFTEL